MTSPALPFRANERSVADPYVIVQVGTSVIRYGLVVVILWSGLLKYTSAEAMAVMPLVAHSPFMAWMLGAFGTHGTADIIGTIEVVIALLIAVRPVGKGRYGSRSIRADLRDVGERCGRKRVVRIVRAAGLRGKQRKAFRVTTKSYHKKPVAPNLLDRKFSPQEIASPDRAWAGDITYIKRLEGWLYLAVLIDLFSRLVIGWSMSHRIEFRLVLDALQMAVDRGRSADNVLSHSDRGSQYADAAVQRFYERHGMTASMSRKANCWDNAAVESFFSTLKRELDDRVFASREEARAMSFEYIEIWYNRQRRHSTLGYVSPEQYEKDQAA